MTPGTVTLAAEAEKARRAQAREIEQFRRDLDRVVQDVARENQGRIHPDLLRMPLVALALSNAALRSVGPVQLREFLSYCVRAGLQPGKTVEALIVPNADTGALELRPHIVFDDVDAAGRVLLPGALEHFEGFGGQPIANCPDAILRGVDFWIGLRPNRPVTYARLRAAIAMVLRARAGATTAQESAS